MDPMDFMKQAWSSFSLPTPFAPTVSLEDLDKRISDLHAIEQWLALNQAMLRNTIQGLEIQRAALGAVQSFAAGIDASQKPVDERFAQTMAHVAAAAAEQAEQARRARAAGADAPNHEDASQAPRGADEDTGPAPVGASGRNDASGKPAGAGSPAPAGPPAVNPIAWWNTLQSGFRDIATAAMKSSPLPAGSSPASVMPFWTAAVAPHSAADPTRAPEAARPATAKDARAARAERPKAGAPIDDPDEAGNRGRTRRKGKAGKAVRRTDGAS